MDIGSGKGYPSSALSNFAPHPFTFRGVECNSMEGLLQSLKFKAPAMQKHVCTLVGKTAKFKGKPKNWHRDQTLYWQGEPINRHSQDYQNLLDEAYAALGSNSKFRAALLATQQSSLTHNIGRKDPTKTILTRAEFVRRLFKLRKQFQAEEKP